MTAILGSDVFQDLEKINPLDSLDDDPIPDRFGPSWFQYEREERKQQRDIEPPQVDDMCGNSHDEESIKQEERIFNKIDSEQVEDLDSHLD